ncbi:MAG: ABC transporter substrate-binding protein [Magnetococcales bacterium]|nr:ABC transporter substrate-binding protein [Magnetococcales bacterium]MBF0151984.1 ABC transporter substrate-binding protein [Magnetococcales bacterium]
MSFKNADGPVLLGLMPPMTGMAHIYGAEIIRAGQLAAMEVNERGGVLGRPLRLVVEDDGSLPASAVVAAQKLVDHHGCLAIIGNLLSSARIAVTHRVAESKKIPMLNFSFYEGSIRSRYFFHFAALPNQQIAKMIPYMRERFGPRMFFAGNNYEWPRGSIDAAKETLHHAGGEVVGEDYYPLGVTDAEIHRLLDQLVCARADVFVPYFAGTDQVTLLTHFARKGLKDRMAVVMGHFDEVMAGHLPPEVRAGYYSSNTYFMTVDTDDNRRVLDRLRTMPGVTGLWPQGNGVLTNFGEGAYVCVKAFAQAVNGAGTLDREAVIDALEAVEVTGPQGLVTMDPATHHARVNTFLTRCDAAGQFAIVARFGAIDPVIPERYDFLRIDDRSTHEDDIGLKAGILEHMAEGICLVRAADGNIVYVNRGFEAMYAYDHGEIIGRPMVTLFDTSPGASQEAIVADIGRHLHRKGVWKGEVRNIRKDGASFWCQLTQSAMTHPRHGEVWIGLYKDITERKEAEQTLSRYQDHLEEIVRQRTRDLEKALKAAESAAKARQTFLVTMSHEIRTPMNGVLGMADLILKSQLTEKQRHYVTTIHRSGRTLLRIINDILDFARIESGELYLEIVGFDLLGVIHDICELFVPRARQQNLEFHWTMVDGLPTHLLGDPYRLNQVLFNLLGNAVKFTERGRIGLAVMVEEDREADVLLRFQVTDTGIGIPPEYMNRIFQHFTQAETSMARRYGGTGLGLAIARQLVHRMDGELWVDSEPGRGSTFWFTARFGKQRPGDCVDVSSFRHDPQSIDPDVLHCEGHVLLVEDNQINQEVAVATLELFGCRVTVVENGQRALNMVQEGSESYDMIFMDCEMPILDGFETTRRLRQWERQTGRHRVPIIALTAHVLTESRQQCLAAGMDDFLLKPFNQNAFGRTLSRWLPRVGGKDFPVQDVQGDLSTERCKDPVRPDSDHPVQGVEGDSPPSMQCATGASRDHPVQDGGGVLFPSSRPGESPALSECLRTGEHPAFPSAGSMGPVLDHVALGRIRDLGKKGDNTLFARMVNSYLERTPELLGNLGNALKNKDHESIRVVVHTLKSSSLTMGVIHLAELGRIMEANHTDLAQVSHYFQRTESAFALAEQALKALIDTQLTGDLHE